MAFALLFWLALAGAVVSAFVLAWRAKHGLVITGIGLLAVATVWVVAKIAYDHDFHDADGFFDCYPSCTALQRAVGVSLIGGAVLGAALFLAFVIAVVRRRGGR